MRLMGTSCQKMIMWRWIELMKFLWLSWSNLTEAMGIGNRLMGAFQWLFSACRPNQWTLTPFGPTMDPSWSPMRPKPYKSYSSSTGSQSCFLSPSHRQPSFHSPWPSHARLTLQTSLEDQGHQGLSPSCLKFKLKSLKFKFGI